MTQQTTENHIIGYLGPSQSHLGSSWGYFGPPEPSKHHKIRGFGASNLQISSPSKPPITPYKPLRTQSKTPKAPSQNILQKHPPNFQGALYKPKSRWGAGGRALALTDPPTPAFRQASGRALDFLGVFLCQILSPRALPPFNPTFLHLHYF